jgi:hypothetical protein
VKPCSSQLFNERQGLGCNYQGTGGCKKSPSVTTEERADSYCRAWQASAC